MSLVPHNKSQSTPALVHRLPSQKDFHRRAAHFPVAAGQQWEENQLSGMYVQFCFHWPVVQSSLRGPLWAWFDATGNDGRAFLQGWFSPQLEVQAARFEWAKQEQFFKKSMIQKSFCFSEMISCHERTSERYRNKHWMHCSSIFSFPATKWDTYIL